MPSIVPVSFRLAFMGSMEPEMEGSVEAAVWLCLLPAMFTKRRKIQKRHAPHIVNVFFLVFVNVVIAVVTFLQLVLLAVVPSTNGDRRPAFAFIAMRFHLFTTKLYTTNDCRRCFA